jgi:sulfite exporter TauE/SafE
MSASMRAAAVLLVALGVTMLARGEVALGVADLVLVGVPLWGVATLHGLRSLRRSGGGGG